jgi:hypothetical protein
MRRHSRPTKIPIGCPFCMRSASSDGEWHARPLFPPLHKEAFRQAILDEILEERVVSSRSRVNPRGVKRKMSNYNLRPRERHPTQKIDFVQLIVVIK